MHYQLLKKMIGLILIFLFAYTNTSLAKLPQSFNHEEVNVDISLTAYRDYFSECESSIQKLLDAYEDAIEIKNQGNIFLAVEILLREFKTFQAFMHSNYNFYIPTYTNIAIIEANKIITILFANINQIILPTNSKLDKNNHWKFLLMSRLINNIRFAYESIDRINFLPRIDRYYNVHHQDHDHFFPFYESVRELALNFSQTQKLLRDYTPNPYLELRSSIAFLKAQKNILDMSLSRNYCHIINKNKRLQKKARRYLITSHQLNISANITNTRRRYDSIINLLQNVAVSSPRSACSQRSINLRRTYR